MKQNMYERFLDSKIIPETNYLVDYFRNHCLNSKNYFLSHFHADHYAGLNKSFRGIIYCSKTTSRLLILKFRLKQHQIIPIGLYERYEVDKNNYVTCIEANHCPGAVCFIFDINGKIYLHTGDFRASESFYEQPFLDYNFKKIFLDNTFENMRSFPPQKVVIKNIIEIILRRKKQTCLVPLKYVLVFATYLIGKEKCFLSVAEFFNKNVFVDNNNKKIYDSYDQYTVNRLNDEVDSIVKYSRDNIDKKFYSTPLSYQGMFDRSNCRTYESINNKTFPLKRDSRIKTIVFKNGKFTFQTLFDRNFFKNDKFDSTNKDLSSSISEMEDLKVLDKEQLENSLVNECFTQKNSFLEHDNRKPFDRITTERKNSEIIVTSTRNITKARIDQVLKGVKCDKVIVFYGSGWKDKVVHYDLKLNNKIIKKGIEVIYISYSEHSSHEELINFKTKMKYESIKNTVNNI